MKTKKQLVMFEISGNEYQVGERLTLTLGGKTFKATVLYITEDNDAVVRTFKGCIEETEMTQKDYDDFFSDVYLTRKLKSEECYAILPGPGRDFSNIIEEYFYDDDEVKIEEPKKKPATPISKPTSKKTRDLTEPLFCSLSKRKQETIMAILHGFVIRCVYNDLDELKDLIDPIIKINFKATQFYKILGPYILNYKGGFSVNEIKSILLQMAKNGELHSILEVEEKSKKQKDLDKQRKWDSIYKKIKVTHKRVEKRKESPKPKESDNTVKPVNEVKNEKVMIVGDVKHVFGKYVEPRTSSENKVDNTPKPQGNPVYWVTPKRTYKYIPENNIEEKRVRALINRMQGIKTPLTPKEICMGISVKEWGGRAPVFEVSRLLNLLPMFESLLPGYFSLKKE